MEVWKTLSFLHRFISIHYLGYLITQIDYSKVTKDLCNCVLFLNTDVCLNFLLNN